MLGWYQARLARRPLLTQSITTAVLFATGDIMAQQGVEKVGPDNHNFARTGRMALYGGALFGPAATSWFAFLSRRINFPTSRPATIIARVAADQAIFAPTNLFMFLSTMALMEGKDPRKSLEEKYKPALKMQYMLWPAVQTVNFAVVPVQGQVLVVNFVSLGWNCYLSFLNSQSK